jgi:hypothetical protein
MDESKSVDWIVILSNLIVTIIAGWLAYSFGRVAHLSGGLLPLYPAKQRCRVSPPHSSESEPRPTKTTRSATADTNSLHIQSKSLTSAR